jgi:hypothetical protein
MFDFLILTLACSAGVYLSSMFSNTILGFIPSSFGGLNGATAGSTASPIVAALASGVIIAGVVAAVGHLHGSIGEREREAV